MTLSLSTSDAPDAGLPWSTTDALPDGILLVDGKAHVQQANGIARSMFGRAQDGLEGTHLGDLFRSEELAASGWSTSLMVYCPRPAAGYRFVQASGMRKDGSLFPCELAIAALASPTDTTRWIVTVRATTHREFHESQLRESVKMAALTDLAARVANDLNNQLAAISGNLESLSIATQHLGSDGVKEIVAARGATQRAARIVRRLSTLGNPTPSKRRPLDVADVVNRVVASVQPEVTVTSVSGSIPRRWNIVAARSSGRTGLRAG